ncbi:MAG: NAD(P)/FAD-dependent oxidoreductase, partial [Ilumatobacteraceae bacterium]
VDVAIVGGGFTGLWTAYALMERDPSIRVVVLESEVVGFGASGRNGGWASALLPMGLTSMAAQHGRDAAIRMQRAMVDAIREIERVTHTEQIDCHFQLGGSFRAARNPAQVERLHDELAEQRAFGFGEGDVHWLDPAESASTIAVTRNLGALFTPHCAAIHPARLVRGLALAVERRGVIIHENSRVLDIEPGRVRTQGGTVRATHIVRATEAFTPGLPGLRRALAPVYSLMIATEPLPPSVWEQIGWADRQTFSDARRTVIYGQRTADDRIAFGGRGAPYHLGSRIEPQFDLHRRVHDGLRDTLRDLFPAIGDVAITHRWGGPVGIPRDWECSVGLDRATGIGWAGGYVGDGVTTTNLAGRTLAALITGDDPGDLTSLLWVDHHSRRWEPEPFRWIGINSMVRMPSSIDRYEDRHDHPERWRSAILERVLGH